MHGLSLRIMNMEFETSGLVCLPQDMAEDLLAPAHPSVPPSITMGCHLLSSVILYRIESDFTHCSLNYKPYTLQHIYYTHFCITNKSYIFKSDIKAHDK